MICQSGRDSPTGGIAWRTRATRRSVLAKVPSFSAKEAAGRTTSASLPVSVRKMSWTTRNSSCCISLTAWLESGSVRAGFSPMMYRALMSPLEMDGSMSVMVFPTQSGRGATPQAASIFWRAAASVTGW